jgi:hypothetical protein
MRLELMGLTREQQVDKAVRTVAGRDLGWASPRRVRVEGLQHIIDCGMCRALFVERVQRWWRGER